MPPEDTPGGDDRRQAEPRAWTSRRRFLEATGVAGLVGGVGGFAFAQQDATTYEFGGEIAGWEGQSPAAIEGETNPTLTLEAGTEYEVVWENLDGTPHDFVVQDADGERLVGTEVVSEQGATLSLTFTATEEMARYVCTIHPSSMVGEIDVGEPGTPTEETATPDPEGFVPEGPTVGAQLVADGPLTSPVTLRSIPGAADSHVVVDQTGQIYHLDGGELRSDPLLDIGPTLAIGMEDGSGFDERGLLGLAFHPNFAENGRFFVRYSSADPYGDDGLIGPGDREFPDDWDHVEVLSEFRMVSAGAEPEVDETSERVLLEVPSPQFNHNGGEVTFGPDGYLYTSVGDGGGANDVGDGHVEDWYDGNDGGNAQNVTANLLGSVLRLDVDEGVPASDEPPGAGLPYGVPDDNPLVGTDGMDEIYAWGLRNAWRMSFDEGTLIAADVGQELYEEVDVVENGGNYGWNVREGFHCFDAANATEPPAQCPTTAPDEPPYDGQELRDPVLEYPHTYEGTSVGISVTGGYVYRGEELRGLTGRYVFGDWSAGFTRPQGRVFVATPDGESGTTAGDQDTMETDGSPTETGAVGGTSTPQTSDGDDQLLPDGQPWPFEEVMIDGGENRRLNRFINAFGRDASGEIYVLASRTGRITGDGGEIYRLVPAGEGEEISQPEVATQMAGGGEGESAGEGGANETTNESTNGPAGEGTANETLDTETPVTEDA